MRFRRVALGAAILLAVVALVFAGSFGALVRARVERTAQKRRLDVQVGRVVPGWFAVTLENVVIRPQGVPGVALYLNEVRAETSATIALTSVAGHGGRLELDGDPDLVRDRLTAFRNSEPRAPGSSERAPSAELSLDGVDLVWRGLTSGEVAARGLAIRKTDASVHASAQWFKASLGEASAEVEGAEVDWSPAAGLERVRARTATVAVAIQRVPKDAPPPVASVSAPSVPVPVALPASPKKGKTKAPEPPDPNAGKPFVKLPELRKAYARIQTLSKAASEKLPVGSSVEVHELRLALHVRDSDLSLGPGPLSIVRRQGILHVTYATSPEAAGPTLSLRADLPEDGDLRVELSGGPVPMSGLGLKEGDLGLVDLARGTATAKGRWILGNKGAELTFDTQLRVHGVSIKEPRLAVDVMRGVDAALGGRGVLTDEGVLRLDDANFEIGQLKASAHGTFEQLPDHVAMSMSAEVYPATCQGILDSLPQALVPTIKGARVAGTFGATARLVFDTRRLDDLVLDHHVGNACRFTEVPTELARDRFAKPFAHRVYGADGQMKDESTGPQSGNWTELEHISPLMQVAVLTTEDGGFFRHRGFNHGAFRNSLVANLKARRFVRGASTISMQLSKNLFLKRDKTLGRKLEELLLTDYLEQNFSKDEMMELYLNIIEFGPDIYGVTRAAEHFFARRPEELNLAESMYLASVLPSPLRFHGHYDAGRVPEGWMAHLHTLMKAAHKTHKISAGEYAEALGQTIEFHKASAPRPAPRPPVSSTRREGAEDDEWQPPAEDPNAF
jgi:hypothetical protein